MFDRREEPLGGKWRAELSRHMSPVSWGEIWAVSGRMGGTSPWYGMGGLVFRSGHVRAVAGAVAGGHVCTRLTSSAGAHRDLAIRQTRFEFAIRHC